MNKNIEFPPELQAIEGFTRVKPSSVKPLSADQIAKLARSLRGDDRVLTAVETIARESASSSTECAEASQ